MHDKLSQAFEEPSGRLATGDALRQSLDDYLRLAIRIAESPIALVSAVDREPRRLVAALGIEVTAAVRELAPRVTISGLGLVVVPDATLDERLADQPLVMGDPGIRFSATVPIMAPDGSVLGALSVLDTTARELTPIAGRALEWLGREAGAHVGLGLALSARPSEPARADSVDGLAAEDTGKDGQGPRVLVVDDNSVNQKVAARMLERLGCRVQVAADGREAVDLVRRLAFDLVFMDCMMPVMDGYEATAAIRGLGAPRGTTPIVAMTANAMQGDRERCLASGMDDYLSKPVHPDQLRTTLDRWARSAASRPDPVDRSVLHGFRQLQEPGAPDVVIEFIDLFLQDLPTHRTAIAEAVRRNDLIPLRSAAHALKSSAAYIGAGDLARLCGEMEAAARSGDAARSASFAGPLAEEAERVCRFLQGQRRAAAR